MSTNNRLRSDPRPGVIFHPGLLAGIDTIANMVRGTLGPLARTVAVSGNFRTDTPEILDDAGIVARRVIQIGDPVADAGAMMMRHALWRVRELHGDGAATTAMIAQTMAHGAVRAVSAGVHPTLMREALTKSGKLAITALRACSEHIRGGSAGRETLRAVAQAMCQDAELCDALTMAVDLVGADGGITIVANEPRTIFSEFIEGSMWETGVLAPGFSHEPGKNMVRLDDAAVVVLAGTLNSAEAVLDGLRGLIDSGRPRVLLVVQGLSDEARQVMLQIQHRGMANLLPVKAPYLEGEAMVALEDICVLTGATQLNTGDTSADDAFARMAPAQAGSARRVWADDKRFGIVAGARNPHLMRERIALLKRQLDTETHTDMLEKLRGRLGRLYGGLAMIRVGAATMKAGSVRRDQAERMARALQSVLSSGVVAGGGAALARVAATLEQSAPVALEARWARDIMAGALRAPLRVIAENAGYDPTLSMHSMTHAAADAVFDVRTGMNAGMRAAGVIDSVETLCSAIRVATSTVAMAVTTDALVLRKAPPTSAFP